MEKEDKIVVLGATGYMGSWLLKYLTDAGFKNIFGSYNNETKADSLQKALPEVNLEKIDVLTDTEKLNAIMTDAKWVFNDTAAFTGTEKTLDDYIVTKTIMANNVMQAIKQSGTVQKIVHLSSVGTIGAGHYDSSKTDYDEDDYSEVDATNIWGAMKVAEEKTVIRWSKTLGIDYVIVEPTNVIGPSFLNWNHDMIVAYLKNGGSLIDSQMDSVDVRDIALMEISVMNNDAAKNIRLLGKGFSLMYSDLVEIVHDHLDGEQINDLFGTMTHVIDQKTAWDVLKNTQDSKYYLENINKINNTLNIHTKYPDLYKYQYRDAKKTIVAALDKMLADQK